MIERRYYIAIGLVLLISCNLNLQEELPVIKTTPSFQLIDQDNRAFTDKNFLGKITVLDFIFTTCMGPCPIMASNMKSLYEQYKKNDKIQFVSITVDPQYDNQKILKEYSENQGVSDSRWKFLTGEIDSIKTISHDGFLLFADDLPIGHSIKFVLIDDKKRIRKYYNGMDLSEIKILKKDIKKLSTHLIDK